MALVLHIRGKTMSLTKCDRCNNRAKNCIRTGIELMVWFESLNDYRYLDEFICPECVGEIES